MPLFPSWTDQIPWRRWGTAGRAAGWAQRCFTGMPREVVQAHIKTGAPCALADREKDEVQVSDMLFKTMMNVLRSLPLGRHVNWTGSRQQRPTICMVPDELKIPGHVVQRTRTYQGYKPVAVRLAPTYFCHYDEYLVSAVDKMEVYKWGSVQQLINQHSSLLLEPARTPVLLLSFLESMMRIMPEINACYEISDSDRKWAEEYYYRDEMTMDVLSGGCFVLHRLLKYVERNGNRGTNQFDQDQGWAWQFVTRDLLLLQNQIPFLAVRKLFQQLVCNKPEDALLTGSLGLFRSFCPELLHSYPRSGPDIAQVHHLLHLFYLSVVHDRPTSTTDSGHHDNLLLPELPQWIPSAKVLEDSGVRFRRMKHAKSFLDISFDVGHGILEIPRLQLYDHSDALFRNLIAFEQTCPGIGRVISAYAIFMDCLIKAPEDMRILNQRGILVSRISGDQNDSGFFSRISAHVPMPADNYLAALMNDVSKNKDYRRHKWYAQLVRNYCSTPWMAMSVFAAVVLLSLTVLQTFFTVYPYYNPRD